MGTDTILDCVVLFNFLALFVIVWWLNRCDSRLTDLELKFSELASEKKRVTALEDETKHLALEDKRLADNIHSLRNALAPVVGGNIAWTKKEN